MRLSPNMKGVLAAMLAGEKHAQAFVNCILCYGWFITTLRALERRKLVQFKQGKGFWLTSYGRAVAKNI